VTRRLVLAGFAACLALLLLAALGWVALAVRHFPAAERFEPPPEWRAEWEWTWATCGRMVLARPVARYDRLRFRVVSGVSWHQKGVGWVDGMYVRGPRGSGLIWLSEGALRGPRAVRHEMLHAMLGDRGGGHHPVFEVCDPVSRLVPWLGRVDPRAL
jgi:hypothetical protein